jgi:hypothetical protein
MRRAFAGDVSATEFAKGLTHLHCDEPVRPVLAPSPMTRERFGRLSRHYVRTLADQAILIAAQDFMIAAVDAEMENHTKTHTFATSHAPYFALPQALAETLMTIAG